MGSKALLPTAYDAAILTLGTVLLSHHDPENFPSVPRGAHCHAGVIYVSPLLKGKKKGAGNWISLTKPRLPFPRHIGLAKGVFWLFGWQPTSVSCHGLDLRKLGFLSVGSSQPNCTVLSPLEGWDYQLL